MKKKIFMFLAALVVSTGAWAQDEICDQQCGDAVTHGKKAPKKVESDTPLIGELVLSFSCSSAGQQAVCTDGTYIYTASWQNIPVGGYTFYQYDLDGNFIEGFNISGATGIRDITTDGEYFYASSGGSNIYVLDFDTRTLVNTINCSGLTSRHITYDPERDGFWSGDWSTLNLYDRDGNLVQTGPAPTSAYGSAYFKDNNGEEHLFLFCQPNSDAKVWDYNITTNTLSDGYIFDFAITPGYSSGRIAGGCFIGEYEGGLCLFGNVQQDPNLVGIYRVTLPAFDIVAGTTEHGTLTFLVDGEEVEEAVAGAEVTVVVTPEEGWISSSVIARPFSSWEVAAARGEAQEIEIIQPINATKTGIRNQWTFTMPANDVEVSVNYIDTDDVIELLRQETELSKMLFRSYGDTKDEELLKEMVKVIGQANSLLKKYDSGQDVSLDEAQDLLEQLQALNANFADVVTGIAGLNQNDNQNENRYYDLQGRRVAQPTKGIYILNGKKVVVK